MGKDKGLLPFYALDIGDIFADTLDGSRWCKIGSVAVCIENFAGWTIGARQDFDGNDQIIFIS